MHEYTYVLSFDPLNQNPNGSQVEIFVKYHRDVKGWYFPILGTYLIKSDKTLAEIVPGFRQFFGDSQFTLTYVVSNLIGGSLPESIWTWINSGTAAKLGDNR